MLYIDIYSDLGQSANSVKLWRWSCGGGILGRCTCGNVDLIGFRGDISYYYTIVIKCSWSGCDSIDPGGVHMTVVMWFVLLYFIAHIIIRWYIGKILEFPVLSVQGNYYPVHSPALSIHLSYTTCTGRCTGKLALYWLQRVFLRICNRSFQLVCSYSVARIKKFNDLSRELLSQNSSGYYIPRKFTR